MLFNDKYVGLPIPNILFYIILSILTLPSQSSIHVSLHRYNFSPNLLERPHLYISQVQCSNLKVLTFLCHNAFSVIMDKLNLTLVRGTSIGFLFVIIQLLAVLSG